MDPWKMLVPNWTKEEAAEDTEVVKDIITVNQKLELEVEELLRKTKKI